MRVWVHFDKGGTPLYSLVEKPTLSPHEGGYWREYETMPVRAADAEPTVLDRHLGFSVGDRVQAKISKAIGEVIDYKYERTRQLIQVQWDGERSPVRPRPWYDTKEHFVKIQRDPAPAWFATVVHPVPDVVEVEARCSPITRGW